MEGADLYDLWHSKYRLWQSRGACHGMSSLFFSTAVRDQERAKSVCREHCPVIRECLAYALLAYEDKGIWGGKTEGELAHIRRLGSIQPRYKEQLLEILDSYVLSLSNARPEPVMFAEFRAVIELAS